MLAVCRMHWQWLWRGTKQIAVNGLIRMAHAVAVSRLELGVNIRYDICLK